MRRFGITLRGLLAAAALAFVSAAMAQQQAPLVGLDPIRASIDQIEAQVRRGGLGMRALYDLSQTLGPLRDQLRTKLEDIEPRLSDVDNRLQGLGPAPAADASENPTIAAQRTRLRQIRGELDAAVQQARLLQMRADQLAQRISERRRGAYAEALFERSPSVFDPSFWREAAAAMPDEIGKLRILANNTWTYARDKADTKRIGGAVLALAAFAAGMIALARLWRRRFGTQGGKAVAREFASLAVFVRAAIAMPLIVIVVCELLDQFGLLSASFNDFSAALAGGVVLASLGRATALALFAPDDPARRPVGLGDGPARSLSSHLIVGSRLLGMLIVMPGLRKIIDGAQVLGIAVDTLFSAAILALLVHLLSDLRPHEEDFGNGMRRRTLWIRPLAWIAVAAIAVALISGYVGLATFVAARAIFTVILLGVLYLLLMFGDRLIGDVLNPASPRSRTMAAYLGVNPRRLGLIGTLLSGGIRALFVLIALALVIGPWEIAAGDFLESIRLAAFGVKIGDFSISFGAVLGAVIVLIVVVALSRIVQRWLETRLLPASEIEPSLQLSIVTVFGYAGYILALVAAMAELGIDPQKIALVAGALSVGIGFGLQSIVSNFVSGLILLAERPIRVGDQIVVKSEEGIVRRISVRATEIETFDKASVIIPNSELITGVVKNWTHANTLGRINIRLATSYEADAERVIAILKSCVGEHSGVLKQPPPAVLLTEFGGATMTFEIFCIVPDLVARGQIKSDIYVAILKAFRAAGIELSPPQQVQLSGAAPNAASP